jgi:hypothetical protein
MAAQADPEIIRLFRQEAHRQRLLSLLLDHGEPASEFEALARDLDAFADRLERKARRQRSRSQLKDRGTLR